MAALRPDPFAAAGITGALGVATASGVDVLDAAREGSARGFGFD